MATPIFDELVAELGDPLPHRIRDTILGSGPLRGMGSYQIAALMEEYNSSLQSETARFYWESQGYLPPVIELPKKKILKF